MVEHTAANLSSKTPNLSSKPRSNRASTLPSSQPTEQSRPSTTAAGSRRPNRHYPYHRHHHSHQIQSNGSQSVHPRLPASQRTDLLSPVKNVAGGLGTLGTKHPGGSSESGMKVFSREKNNKVDSAPAVAISVAAEGGTNLKHQKDGSTSKSKDHSPADVQKLQTENQRREKALTASYTSLASHALASSVAVSRAHDSLIHTLASTQQTLSQLQKLRSDSAELLATLTTKSIPNLTRVSQDRLTTLQQIHSDAENTRLAGLEARVDTARDRTAGLRQRVEVCAERVRREEAKVREERKRRQWWVGFVWALLGVAVLAWVSATVWKRWAEAESGGPRHQKRAELRRRLDERGMGWVLDDEEEAGKQAIVGDSKNTKNVMTSPVRNLAMDFANMREADRLGQGSVEHDERLARIFHNL